MGKTYRKTKNPKIKIDDKEVSPFWYRHDSKEDRDGLNREFRHEEKQYFHKFGEPKYNQKPKSRGWKTH